MGNIKYSIIVPFHINERQLEYCLRGIISNNIADSEIIIIGNNVPNIREQIKDSRIKTINLQQTIPYPVAINYAVDYSKGKLLFFLDQDTYVFEDWFGNILKFYTEKRTKESIGIASSKLICPTSGKIIDYGIAFTKYNAPHPWKGHSPDFALANRSYKVQAACSAAMLIDKELFLSAGGFDAELPYSYCDIDLCLRLKEKGFSTWVVKDAKAYHFNGFPKSNNDFYKEDTKSLFSIKNYHRIEFDMPKYLHANYQCFISNHQLQNSYFLVDMTTVIDRDWYSEFIIKELRISVLDKISIPYPKRDSHEINLYNALSWSVLRKKNPLIFFVDSMNSLKDNDLWFNSRNCSEDLVIDRNGNIITIQDLYL
ncbi:glycosyltransferase family 2 protein [Tenacibaculum sp.]|uniref:glycosyltransferase family 2 protein n=1 Tax=Tenacibaculum sp. TaxID=1906242 RepID=UPI003D0E8F92